MKKTTIRDFRNSPALTVLWAVFFILLCFAGGISYSKTNGGLPLLRATEDIAETGGGSASDEPQRTAPQKANEWQTVKMRVTAYCPCEKCCGKYSDGITACGHRIRPGDAFVAADKKYEFGTEMSIPGYNHSEPVRVLDRGGAIRADRLDVFFDSHNEALSWGFKYLYVKVRQKSSGP